MKVDVRGESNDDLVLRERVAGGEVDEVVFDSIRRPWVITEVSNDFVSLDPLWLSTKNSALRRG